MPKIFAKTKCGKIGYDSAFEARARGFWLNLMKPAKHPKTLRAYACSACMKWHLSSKNE